MSRTLLGLAVLAMSSGASLPASADDLTRATQRFDSADFEGALELLDSVERMESLSRDELVRLIVTRVMASFALGDRAAVESELARLAEIPEAELPDESPPSLRRAFHELRSQITAASVSVELENVRGTLRVQAAVAGGDSIARGTRLECTSDSGRVAVAAGPRMRFDLPEGEVATCTAQIIGPGGAVIAQSHSTTERAPAKREAVTLTEEPPVESEAEAVLIDADSDDTGWSPAAIILVSGAVVLAVGAIVTSVLYAAGAFEQSRSFGAIQTCNPGPCPN